MAQQNYLWSIDEIDNIVKKISRNSAKKHLGYKPKIEEIRIRLKYVLLQFSDPRKRKHNILRKFIRRFPEQQACISYSQLCKIADNAPSGHVRDALFALLLNVFSSNQERLYNSVRNKLIDEGQISTDKVEIIRHRRSRSFSSFGPVSKKHSQFVGLTGGVGLIMPNNPRNR